MKQTVCDRCDVVVAGSNENNVRELALIEREDGAIEDLGDLCCDCIKQLRAWLNPPRRQKRPA